MRHAGILLPISSLPSPYGIGTFSRSARDIVDMLKKADQHYWQILPLGPTGYGDSPYQSFSAFAGNPYFIDLDQLIEQGLLERSDVEDVDFGTDETQVDYEKLYLNRFTVLRKAYKASRFDYEATYTRFVKENEDWLHDYALFMALKNANNGKSWFEWPDDIRLRDEKAIAEAEEKYADEIHFYCFLQYEFSMQWQSLKQYANSQGIEIIGDIPIYVASDSSDSWAHPELFQFDEDRKPTGVAGCPPDAFSADGQLWGNPLYNWEYQEQTGYRWWKRRIDHCLKLYDVVRVDHFRGFDEYYDVPYGDDTARNGKWMPGPGMKLFNALKENPKVTPKSIIAEDLGFLTPSVIQLVKDSGFPGMKVIEFAFDSRDAGDYLPYNYTNNSIVYTGTHDNQTLDAWYDELCEDDRKLADDYLGLEDVPREKRYWAFIRMALQSVSDTCVIPMQDYLGLGGWARMNHPSTLGGNWCWRLKEGEFTEELARKIRRQTIISGRAPREYEEEPKEEEKAGEETGEKAGTEAE